MLHLRLDNEAEAACWHAVKTKISAFIFGERSRKIIDFTTHKRFHFSDPESTKMLFEKFQNNPFAKPVKCDSQGETNHEATSVIPGREIAAAAAVSNVILEGG